MLLGRKTGILDFLVTTGSLKLDLNNVQTGKKFVKTKLVYKKPTKACEILEDGDVPTNCEAGDQPVESSVDVTINKRIGTATRSFNNTQMINICQDTEAFIREYMMSDMKAMREKAAEYLLAAADAAAGVNHSYSGTDVPAGTNTNLQLIGESSDTGTIVPLFGNFNKVALDYENNQFTGFPHLVGQGILHEFFKLAKWSCCNSSGVAYDAAIAESAVAYYLDQAANSVLGANEFLSFAPGAAHLLWFNENHNININQVDRVHTVVPDPVYPMLKYDFDFWFDCKVWNYKLSTYLDFFAAIQDDAFGDDEASPSPACETELLGVNGIFKYKATNA